MRKRISPEFNSLNQLTPLLNWLQKLFLIWEYLPHMARSLLDFPELGHLENVQHALELINQLDDEEHESFNERYTNHFLGAIRRQCRAIIEDAKHKLPTKTLACAGLTLLRQFRSRDLTTILLEYELNVSNISTTLQKLEQRGLIEVATNEEGKEKAFTLTSAGKLQLKDLMKDYPD